MNPQPIWSVYRLDDDNNQFLVATEMTKQQAIALIEYYEGKGNKHTYFAKPIKSGAESPPDAPSN